MARQGLSWRSWKSANCFRRKSFRPPSCDAIGAQAKPGRNRAGPWWLSHTAVLHSGKKDEKHTHAGSGSHVTGCYGDGILGPARILRTTGPPRGRSKTTSLAWVKQTEKSNEKPALSAAAHKIQETARRSACESLPSEPSSDGAYEQPNPGPAIPRVARFSSTCPRAVQPAFDVLEDQTVGEAQPQRG